MRGVKTFAILALVVLCGLASCGGDEPLPAAPKSSRSTQVATKKPMPPVEPIAPEMPTQPVMLPPGERRILELEGGVRVEVLAEGLGPVVGPGDEVALSLTLSYVPEPAKVEDAQAESKDEAKADAAEKRPSKKGSKGGQKATSAIDNDEAPVVKEPIADVHGDAKSDPKHAAEPTEHGTEKTPEVASEHPVAGTIDAGTHGADSPDAMKTNGAEKPVEHIEGAHVDTGAKPADTAVAEPEAIADGMPAIPAEIPTETPPADTNPPTTPPTTPPTDAPPPAEGTAPAPEPLAPALEPIVVVSTKNLGTPIRARVGTTTTLVPGLSRALVGLRQGTIAEITLPPEAGYGAAGLPSAGIPPGTTLHATIEIREVKR